MASLKAGPKVSIPSEADLKHLSEDERLMQAAKAAQAASSAQGMVDSLKSKAAMLTNPKERERVLSEVYNREIEAKGHSKKARVLQSGSFQGAAGGAGVGAATGLGIGTLVGTLVGTVASVPTTALGGVVGAGTGVIHGPWIKLGGGGKKESGAEDEEEEDDEEKVVQVPQEAIDSGAVQVDDKTGQVTVKDPEALKEATASAEQQGAKVDTGKRRKPPKLEIRSNKQAVGDKSEPPTHTDAKKTRRKPPKLEVRSTKAE
jgi:hypothetical protein